MKISPKVALRVGAASLTLLPASCGSFYAAEYFGGKTEPVEACALDCGDEVPVQSSREAASEAILIAVSVALILVWAWIVKKILEKVV